MDLQGTIPYPKDMQPIVWFLKSGFTPYAASSHLHNWFRPSSPISLLSSMVCFRYCNNSLNFSLSSLVLLVTMVHRNAMAGKILVLPFFPTHSNFATMEWKMSASFFSSIVELSSILCRPLFYGDDTFVLSSSPKKPIDFSI